MAVVDAGVQIDRQAARRRGKRRRAPVVFGVGRRRSRGPPHAFRSGHTPPGGPALAVPGARSLIGTQAETPPIAAAPDAPSPATGARRPTPVDNPPLVHLRLLAGRPRRASCTCRRRASGRQFARKRVDGTHPRSRHARNTRRRLPGRSPRPGMQRHHNGAAVPPGAPRHVKHRRLRLVLLRGAIASCAPPMPPQRRRPPNNP